VIGVLVHIEHQHRSATGQRRGVIRRPLVDEALVARRVGQDYPAGAAAFCLAHRGKFSAPTVEAAEIADDGLRQRATRTGATTEPVEIYLMQDHRVRSDQLFTLQAVDHEVRRFGEIELGQLRADRVEALHGANVVIFIMAHENLFRDALDRLRVE
jgi:hypothetical protein